MIIIAEKERKRDLSKNDNFKLDNREREQIKRGRLIDVSAAIDAK